MMNFDPDKFIQEQQNTFDPDKFIAETKDIKPVDSPYAGPIRTVGTAGAIAGSFVPLIGDTVISPLLMGSSEFLANIAEGKSALESVKKAGKVSIADFALGMAMPAALSVGKKLGLGKVLSKVGNKIEPGTKIIANQLTEFATGRTFDDLVDLAKIQKRTGKTILTKKQGKEAIEETINAMDVFNSGKLEFEFNISKFEDKLSKLKKGTKKYNRVRERLDIFRKNADLMGEKLDKTLDDYFDLLRVSPENADIQIERLLGLDKKDLRITSIDELLESNKIKRLPEIKKKDLNFTELALKGAIMYATPSNLLLDIALGATLRNDTVQRLILSKLGQEMVKAGYKGTEYTGKRLLSRKSNDLPVKFYDDLFEYLDDDTITNTISNTLEEYIKGE